METAKLFENGRSQAVRLPKEFRFDGDEVFIKKLGNCVLLFPKDDDVLWETFMEGVHGFTDDQFEAMESVRDMETDVEREEL